MEEEGGKVRALIDKATNSTAREVDPRLLKAIKSVVRYSDSELRLAAQTLMDLMKRDHSQVRYLTLLIIDELFMRSKLFRALVAENMDQLLSLSVGFRRNLSLPAPPAIASILRSKAIEFLEKWNASFGVHYRQIRLGYDYLKNTLRFQFPNLQANATRIQQERREREMRTKEILRNKFGMLRQNFSSIKKEIQSTVDEIGECLDILCAKEENMLLASLDDEDLEEFHSSELRQIRFDSLKEGEKVHENNDNKVVFDALRELYKLLVSKHLVSVQEWISVLIRVEVPDSRFRDSTLKEFIDIRNRLLSVKKKCEESGCTLANNVKPLKEEEEEDFWEEGKIGSTEDRKTSTPNENNINLAMASTSGEVRNEDPKSSNEKYEGNGTLDHESGKADSTSLRSKLLTEAPMIEWGSYLNYWGLDREVLANQRGLEIDNHWGRVDFDAVIPAEKIAELNLRASRYKEEPVEIQPCRAPLKKGGLCQRRDLEVCPFHGPIIPRDDEGNPINQSSSIDEELTKTNQISSMDTLTKTNSSIDEMTSDFGSDLTEQLAKQAVKNIRDRDKEKARKRKIDKQLLSRAKLAKVREHNEAVLRDAALASTSRSAAIGEEMEVGKGKKPLARNKKPTLASMLRNKQTAKDRLAQRLLNTRTRDSTIRQLTMGEDANYREAFPNQW
ncbi:UV-stimulated scaffold protein A homolog [Pistacia vera]|uniref:UV-stimulated scaffold protein A homolog n=1 Tax=Pistacia vera TaxID=55513 RepID=UPI0012633BBE|nr:UV-stimulated scaffold protein A homolog [Pistacia vera]